MTAEHATIVLTDAELQGVLWAIDRGLAYDDGFSYPRDQNREILRAARAKIAAHKSTTTAWRGSHERVSAAIPTEFVECDRCDGDGEIEGEDFFCYPRVCWQCGGTGTVEVCASCLDTGEECDVCGR
jgi:hypothetical protein